MKQLKEMLQWKRPGSGDMATKFFAERYLTPVFGEPDESGNYILTVNNSDGSAPNLCFTAHYDTVHSEGGFQSITEEDNVIYVEDSDCLGADCTTGLWLCLEMISEFIPGVYVIHADEESGCIGSSNLVASKPSWLDTVDAVISFDRMGDTSVVTHQMGRRTASDTFAKSFAEALNMPELKPDNGGVFTDSNEYADVVSECTNISVGYYKQHTSNEFQDVVFLQHLRDSLINADWSKLVFCRDASVDNEYAEYTGYSSYSRSEIRDMWELDDLYQLVSEHPTELSDWFHDQGITAEEIAREAGIDYSRYVSGYLGRDVA